MMNIHVFYESLKELIGIIAKEEQDKTKIMASIFVLTSIISVVGFIVNEYSNSSNRTTVKFISFSICNFQCNRRTLLALLFNTPIPYTIT